MLGFTSVYREGFETVLFLQALVLEAGVARVAEGVALGALGVAASAVLTIALQRKLPHRRMLELTGAHPRRPRDDGREDRAGLPGRRLAARARGRRASASVLGRGSGSASSRPGEGRPAQVGAAAFVLGSYTGAGLFSSGGRI